MDVSGIVRLAFIEANRTHDSLGRSGIKKTKQNRFGDLAVRGDFECEEAVIETCRKHKLPVTIVSEEHGIVRLAKNPKYLGILDGIDGSSNYIKGFGKKRYGTIFSVFGGADPKYSDWLCGGTFEHSPVPRLLFAEKGKGAFLNGKRVFCSGETVPLRNRLLVDGSGKYDFSPVIERTFIKPLRTLKLSGLRPTQASYIDVASGKADAFLQCTRKSNLEIAGMYGVIREAGGVTVSLDGKELGGRKYFSFGQKEFLPIIVAATTELARRIIGKINE
ncbi:MAG: inositol monophosphatase family protein [archaeon]